jgi:hypothetical protein
LKVSVLATFILETTFTLMLQKSRVPLIQGVKGEAVLDYREPLTIPQYCGTGTGDAVPSTFPEGKQQGEFFIDLGSHLLSNLKITAQNCLITRYLFLLSFFRTVVYGTLGFTALPVQLVVRSVLEI